MKRLALVSLLLLILLAACAHAQKPDTLPPLPDTVYTAMGPIRVVRVANLTSGQNGGELYGRFEGPARTIYVNARITDRTQQYQTLFHEVCHAVQLESGLRYLIEAQVQDILCDVWATWAVADLRRRTR